MHAVATGSDERISVSLFRGHRCGRQRVSKDALNKGRCLDDNRYYLRRTTLASPIPRIDDGDTGSLEIPTITGNHRETVVKRGCGDKREGQEGKRVDA